MIESIISSKTRISLLVKFFLNKNTRSYLRGLATEFNESTNSIRIELNRLEKAGLLSSVKESNKKIYQANTSHPLFSELNNIVLKHTGINTLIEKVIDKVGEIDQVYLIGDLANGIDNKVIDLHITGRVNTDKLSALIRKAENKLNRKINYQISSDTIEKEIKGFLIWENQSILC